MVWKNIPNNKVPRWVKRKKRAHVRGRNYLYRKRGKVWQKKLKPEWEDKTPWWRIILISVVATIIAAIIIKWFRL